MQGGSGEPRRGDSVKEPGTKLLVLKMEARSGAKVCGWPVEAGWDKDLSLHTGRQQSC